MPSKQQKEKTQIVEWIANAFVIITCGGILAGFGIILYILWLLILVMQKYLAS